jgi:hypothetical protein
LGQIFYRIPVGGGAVADPRDTNRRKIGNCHCTLINQILRIGRDFDDFCTLNCNISTGLCVSV